jgi:hypothetical protein
MGSKRPVSYNFALLPRKEIGCNTQQSNINVWRRTAWVKALGKNGVLT